MLAALQHLGTYWLKWYKWVESPWVGMYSIKLNQIIESKQ